MKHRGDQTEIMLLRPCVITPAFNYVDIWPGQTWILQKLTKSHQTPAFHSVALIWKTCSVSPVLYHMPFPKIIAALLALKVLVVNLVTVLHLNVVVLIANCSFDPNYSIIFVSMLASALLVR